MLDGTNTTVTAVAQPTGNSDKSMESAIEKAERIKKQRLANLKPFKKGQSGNPRGRIKKDLDLAEEARKHAEVALNALVEVAANPESPPSARVSAAGEILDRGYGRAPQTLDVEHKHSLSQEFENFIRALADRTPRSRMIEAEVIPDAAE